MQYGKPFGVGATGGVVVLGMSIGYGWVVLGALVITTGLIIAIRYFFRKNKPLNK